MQEVEDFDSEKIKLLRLRRRFSYPMHRFGGQLEGLASPTKYHFLRIASICSFQQRIKLHMYMLQSLQPCELYGGLVRRLFPRILLVESSARAILAFRSKLDPRFALVQTLQ